MLQAMAGFAMVALLMAGCSAKTEERVDTKAETVDTSAEDAAAVALEAYKALYRGQTGRFLDLCAHSSKFTGGYHDQMLLNYRRHVEHVDTTRQGVKAVSVVNAEKDESLQMVKVNLLLSYGNGTSEEIVVPMVKSNGEWKIK